MFLFKQLGSLIWGGEKRELIESSGRLYIFDKNQWRCLFNQAKGLINRSDEPFTYYLTVTRVYEEGEEELEEEKTQDQLIFPITEAMQLTKDRGIDENIVLSFTDQVTRKRYQFEFDTDAGQMVDVFLQTIARCIFENKSQRAYSDTDEAEIQHIISSVSSPAPSPQKLQSTPKTDNNNNNNNANTPKPDAESGNKTMPASQRVISSQAVLKFEPVSPGEDLIKVPAQLYLLDYTTQVFQEKDRVTVALRNISEEDKVFRYQLIVQKAGTSELMLTQTVNSDMHAHFNDEYRSIIWTYSLGTANVWTWSVVFADSETDNTFKDMLARCLWETNTGKPFGKSVKKEDVEWIRKGYSDDVKMEEDDGQQEADLSDFIDEEEERRLDEKPEEEEQEQEAPVDDGSDDEDDMKDLIKGTNSLLSVGLKSDRSFVVRGSQIGVFKHTPSNKVKFVTSINKLKTKEGQYFSPKKMMLHQEDTSMLLLHPNQSDKVFRMDLTRGDIVEEWKCTKAPINDILPQTKYAQMTDEKTLLGLNKLGFALIDPRLPNDKVVDTRSFMYKPTTRPELSCAATTETGQMVVGSKTGEIRMFSQKTMNQPKKDIDQAPRAKTTLPGFGDPVIGVDVTADGKWILATCKTYLLLIPTQMTTGTNGFETTMGKEKPVPRRLQLRPEHIARMGGNISFTPAHFNTGTDMERSIVTSTGPFIVTWNFRKVKQNKLNEYQIREYKDTIVADEFRYGTDAAIVVATPNNVTMAQKAIKTFSPVKI